MLELYLQHGVDKPVDYDPIDRLVGIYNDIVDKKLLSITEYAKSVNLSEREIKREVDKAKLMVEFLEFIDAPKQFHLARKLNINDPLKELNTIMKQCKDEDRREDLKNVFFANLLIRPKGDATRYVRDIKKIAIDTNFLDNYLEEQMELTEKVCDLLEECGDINEEVINEKILTQNELQKDCFLLDYDTELKLEMKTDSSILLNNRIYKLRLKRYIDSQRSNDNVLRFKSHYTYVAFKKIINMLEIDSKKRNYRFFVTDRLKRFISETRCGFMWRNISIKQLKIMLIC